MPSVTSNPAAPASVTQTPPPSLQRLRCAWRSICLEHAGEIAGALLWQQLAAILDSAPTRDHDDLTKVVNLFLASEHPQRERQLAGELRAAVGRFAEFDDEQTADPSPELYESFDELLSILNAAADQFDARPSTSAAAVHLAPAPPAPPAPTPGPFHLRNDFLPARTATPPPPPPAVPLTWGLRQSPRAQQLADACSQQLREEAALQVFRTALILRNFRLAAGGASRRRLQLATR